MLTASTRLPTEPLVPESPPGNDLEIIDVTQEEEEEDVVVVRVEEPEVSQVACNGNSLNP